MSRNYQSLPGMHDVLPAQTPLWQWVESQARQLLGAYGYHEIRMPLLEKTELFSRSIGDVTDIVEKEMYTFTDNDGQSVSLRPEGTASCVRAVLEHHLTKAGTQKLWYQGPMFRHERQQKGRYRQFHQIGVEVFGVAEPEADAEIILLSARLWQRLGISDVTLEINSLGSAAARQRYRAQLVQYFSRFIEQLDEDSRRRLQRNPLRILDSKNPQMVELLQQAPKISDALDPECQIHFEQVLAYLDQAGVPYRLNSRLVRGLDYYNRTVFEWTAPGLGSQNAICSGGRFDSLVEMLGGPPTPAIGLALGQERVNLLLGQQAARTPPKPDAYIIMVGEGTRMAGMRLAEQIRDGLPDVFVQYHLGAGSFKSQMRQADRSGAELALLLGEGELAQANVTIKFLRREQPQAAVAMTDVIPYIANYFQQMRQE